MRFEELAESLHRRFVGLGMVVFFCSQAMAYTSSHHLLRHL
jgi:hypothetical protein